MSRVCRSEGEAVDGLGETLISTPTREMVVNEARADMIRTGFTSKMAALRHGWCRPRRHKLPDMGVYRSTATTEQPRASTRTWQMHESLASSQGRVRYRRVLESFGFRKGVSVVLRGWRAPRSELPSSCRRRRHLCQKQGSTTDLAKRRRNHGLIREGNNTA